MSKKKNKKALPATINSNLERLAEEGKLTESDVAILHEVALNRKAIVKLGAIALDHERRIGNLEEALADLAGEDQEPIDIEAEKDEEEDE